MKICERHTNTHATISDRSSKSCPKRKGLKTKNKKKKKGKPNKQVTWTAEKPTKTFEESNVEPKQSEESGENESSRFFLIICTKFLRRFVGSLIPSSSARDHRGAKTDLKLMLGSMPRSYDGEIVRS